MVSKPRRVIKADAILERVRSEQSSEPLELELYGETFKLPAQLPATVLVGFAKMANEDPSGLTEALAALFGDSLPVLLAHDVSFDELTALLEAISAEYGAPLGKASSSPEPSPTTSES